MSAVRLLRASVDRLLGGGRLGPEELRRAFDALVDDGVPPVLKGSFLTALRAKGESPEELAALARCMLERARAVAAPPGTLVDTCGTGGDGSCSVNLSTAAALVVAATGVRVAKHGNRSVSSRAGSADLIEALGIPFASTPEEARRSLVRHRFAFLFAPAFHPAASAIAGVRRELGLRTVFNVLGPLVNPARPTHQLTGTGDAALASRMAHALAENRVRRAFVVHGALDWDEATPVGPFRVHAVENGGVTQRTLQPADYGIAPCRDSDLVGGDARRNAAIVRAVFAGKRDGPLRHVRDAIALNAALVLQLVGAETDPRAAAERALSAIDRGDARALVDALRGGPR